MKATNILVFQAGVCIEVIPERPYRQLPNGELGVVYKRKVHPVVNVSDQLWIFHDLPTFTKDECPVTNSKPATFQAPSLEVAEFMPDFSSFEPQRLVGLWRNCMFQKYAVKGSKFQSKAETYLRGIGEEWEKRAENEDCYSLELSDSYSPISIFKNGYLSHLGYHVGMGSRLSTGERRAILLGAGESPLPPLHDVEYRDDWGEASTQTRYLKILQSLEAFASAAEASDTQTLRPAIHQWAEDASFLRRKWF